MDKLTLLIGFFLSIFLISYIVNRYLVDVFPEEKSFNEFCCQEKKKHLKLKGILSDKIAVKNYLKKNLL